MATILIIEDDPILSEGLAELLSLEGFEALCAYDGYEGIELSQIHQPDVILCDINLPNCNGYAVLEALRENSLTAHIPLIFLTSHADKKAVEYGINLGAAAYITKPFSNDFLIKAITRELV